MCEMAYVRVQKRGDKLYYYLVESKREGKKVHQRTMRYLGTEKPEKTEIERIVADIEATRGGGRGR